MSGFAHDVAGGSGNLIAVSVQSPNFRTGVQGWQIRRDGSAEFDDVTIRGGVTVDGTTLAYSGTPAAGNLVYSQSPAGGTDPHGNVYLAGAVTYLPGSPVFAQRLDGSFIEYLSAATEAGPWTVDALITGNSAAIDISARTFGVGTGGPLTAWYMPSGDTTGTGDSATISFLLGAGIAVTLVPGTYYLGAPLSLPSGAVLAGAKGNTLSLTGYGSILAAGTSFAGASLISLPAGSEEQYLHDFLIDASAAPAGTHGIGLAAGACNSVRIENVAVSNPPGSGLFQAAGTSALAWDVRGLVVHRAGLSGINFTAPDSTWTDCYVIGSGQVTGSDGWVISTASNSNYIGCRVEDTLGGNGFRVRSANKAGNGVSFTGCSTQGNAFDGFSVSAATGSASPVSFTGCRANEDGVNGGAGGGGFAGFAFRGCSAGNPVYTLSGCITTVGTQFTAGAPVNGLAVDTAAGNHIRAAACLLWGLSAGVQADGTAAVLDTTLSTTGTGLPATPAAFTG